MNGKTSCPKCGRELTGAIDLTTTNDGKYVFIVQTETSDCNWTRCISCKKAMCKPCRRDQPGYCCPDGRVVEQERAQAAFILANSHKHET